ncbi:MAG: sensor histidine kinase [Mycobacterium sp.]
MAVTPQRQSRVQLTARASTLGLLMRHAVTAGVSVVALCDPSSPAPLVGRVILVFLVLWSAYRLIGRSTSWRLICLDYGVVIAVCLAIPVLTPDPLFFTFNSAPQAVAGTAVISFAVAVPIRYSLLMTLGIAAAYACGAAQVTGWAHIGVIGALYYFALQWIASSLIRMMLVRVAETVDGARHAREAAELDETVASAVREYELEQLSMLHDTAASTLLMVGQNTEVAGQLVAAQASRDLEVLPAASRRLPSRIDLAAALRDCATHIATPTIITAPAEMWSDGPGAQVIIAAAREAMNNVDRHAKAGTLRVTAHSDRIILQDNGVGFDPAGRVGHGITHSIVNRMERIGGSASIRSAPGEGATVELRWPATPPHPTDEQAIADPDKLIDRMRFRYGLAITGYALANVAFSLPHGALTSGASRCYTALGVVCVVSTVALIPNIWDKRWFGSWIAAATLLVVGVVQTLLLPVQLIGGAAHWAQGAIGWCLMPLVLGLQWRIGAAMLVGSWSVVIATQLVHNPSTVANAAYGTASILGVQLYALYFNGMMRDAATTAHAETQRHHKLVADELVAAAVHTEYQKRLAAVVSDVIPVLQELSRSETIDAELRQQARTHSRKLRTLFDRVDIFENPLLQQLRPCIDAAEVRHVAITVESDGSQPELSPAQILVVVELFAVVLAATHGSARLVFGTAAGGQSASLVASGIAAGWTCPPGHPDPDTEVDIVAGDDEVWVEVRMGCGAADPSDPTLAQE